MCILRRNLAGAFRRASHLVRFFVLDYHRSCAGFPSLALLYSKSTHVHQPRSFPGPFGGQLTTACLPALRLAKEWVVGPQAGVGTAWGARCRAFLARCSDKRRTQASRAQTGRRPGERTADGPLSRGSATASQRSSAGYTLHLRPLCLGKILRSLHCRRGGGSGYDVAFRARRATALLTARIRRAVTFPGRAV